MKTFLILICLVLFLGKTQAAPIVIPGSSFPINNNPADSTRLLGVDTNGTQSSDPYTKSNFTITIGGLKSLIINSSTNGNGVLNMTAATGHGGGAATNATPAFTGQVGTSDFGSSASYLWQSSGTLPGQWNANWSFDFCNPGFFGNHESQPYNTSGSTGWKFWVNGNRGNQTNNVNADDVVAWFYNGNLWHYSQISVVGVVTNAVDGGVSEDLNNWASFGDGNPLSVEAFAGKAFLVVIKQPFTIAQTAAVGNDGVIGSTGSGSDAFPDHQVTSWDFVGHTIHFGHLVPNVYAFTNTGWLDAMKLDYQNDTLTVRSNIITKALKVNDLGDGSNTNLVGVDINGQLFDMFLGSGLSYNATSKTLSSSGSGSGTVLPPNALGLLSNNGSGTTNWYSFTNLVVVTNMGTAIVGSFLQITGTNSNGSIVAAQVTLPGQTNFVGTTNWNLISDGQFLVFSGTNASGVHNAVGTNNPTWIPTNLLASTAIDFSRKFVSTNLAGNLTLSSFSNINPTNLNIQLIQVMNTSGVNRTVTVPTPANVGLSDTFVSTNNTTMYIIAILQSGVMTNVWQKQTITH